MATKKDAKRIVSEIATKYGYIDQSDWDELENLNPVLRKTFEERMKNTQEIAAKTITTCVLIPGNQHAYIHNLSSH